MSAPFFLCSLNADSELTRNFWLERDNFFHLFILPHPFSSRKLPKITSRNHRFFNQVQHFCGERKMEQVQVQLPRRGTFAKKWGWLYIHSEKWRLLYWAKAWCLILDKNLWMWWKFWLSKGSDVGSVRLLALTLLFKVCSDIVCHLPESFRLRISFFPPKMKTAAASHSALIQVWFVHR